jgi:integrase
MASTNFRGRPSRFPLALALRRPARALSAIRERSSSATALGKRPVLDLLGISHCGLHAFRHTHTSLLLDTGATPKVVQEQLRHSDARITLGVYGHVIGDAQRDAVNKVGELLRPEFCAQMRPK